MLPILLIGGAALVLLSGGKKKSSGKSGGGTDPGGTGSKGGRLTMSPNTGPVTGEPWESCSPPVGSPKRTFAAYGKDRKCMIFWGPSTWEVAQAFIESDLSKLSQAQRDEICSHGECVPDPYAVNPDLFCEWTDNPAMVAAVKRVCIAMYPQLEAASFPPVETSTYFPAMVWKFVWAEYAKYHCGFEPVT